MAYTHGHEWKDEEILEDVKAVVNATGLDRMPSSKEIVAFYKNYRLVIRNAAIQSPASKLDAERQPPIRSNGKDGVLLCSP